MSIDPSAVPPPNHHRNPDRVELQDVTIEYTIPK